MLAGARELLNPGGQRGGQEEGDRGGTPLAPRPAAPRNIGRSSRNEMARRRIHTSAEGHRERGFGLRGLG